MALALFAFVVVCAYTACTADVVADASLSLDTSAGLNYEEALVTPHAVSPGGGELLLVVTDPVSGFSILPGQPLTENEYSFPNQTVAQMVTVDGYILSGAATNAAAHELLLMGRLHESDNWLYETAETFSERSGTGVWTGTDYASVSNDQIVIDTERSLDVSTAVTCTIGDVPTPRRGCVVAADVTFPTQTLGLADPSGQRLGLTIGYLDDDWQGGVRFLYVTNGAWCATPRTVCDPLASVDWQIRIAVDYEEQQATYYARAASTNAWTILGTATGIGTDSLTELSFRGTGAIAALEGHGFDAQLIQVDVEFDDAKSLYPGCNFEQTVVTGRVVSSVIHSTDRTGGTYTVRLVDLDGNVVTAQDYSFTADGTMEFYVQADDLKAGSAYRAIVDLGNAEAQVDEAETDDVAVMGRALTDGDWAVRDFWMYENAATFDGDEPGSGDWSGKDNAYTSDDWICVVANSEGTSGSLPGISFKPTNEIGEAYSSLLASVRVIFEDVSMTPGATDDSFGVTVTMEDGELVFACLDNHVWQTISRSVAAPKLGVEYEFSFYVQFDCQKVVTVVTLPNGRRVTLHTATLDSALYTKLVRVRAAGAGKITDLTGVPYSTELLRITTEFDDGTLYPGLNFENSSANGYVSVEQLWETDRTNSQYRVVVRDRNGEVVREQTFDLKGVGERQRFELFIEGLEAGETYSAEVVSDVTGVATDGTTVEDVMGRMLTDDDWAVTNKWVYENARTFAGAERGSGVWTGQECAHTNGDWICVWADSDEAKAVGVDRIAFVPTNSLDETYSTLVSSIRISFSESCLEPCEPDGAPFGVTLAEVDGKQVFMCLSNDVWQTIPRSVVAPELEVAYEFSIYVRLNEAQMTYLVTLPSGRQVPLLSVSYDAERFPCLSKVEVYGNGNATDLTGIPYSTDLIRVTTVFDDGTLYPGLNFENSSATGHVTFEKLWETDRTSGDLRIVVRDGSGLVVTNETFAYAGIEDWQWFELYLQNLAAGESYTVEIVSDVEGVGTDDATAEDIMGRMLTNVNWAVTNKWVYENARTFAGVERGSGVWSGRACAYTNGDWICVRSNSEAAELAEVHALTFQPTNELNESFSTYVSSVRAVFSEPYTDFEETNNVCGITVTSAQSGSAFACLSNGVWQTVSRSIARPELGVEYELSFHLQKENARLVYYATLPTGRRVRLLTVALDAGRVGSLGFANYIVGTVDITDLTGELYSTELLRITTEFDDDTLYPGMNFEESTANGWVSFEKLWETDRTNELLNVVVRDIDGNIVTNQTFRYSGIDERQRFEFFIQGLEVGETYSAEIVSDVKGVTSDETTTEDVMARALTNADWAVTNMWIYENARTFAGAERGSGVWSDTACAHTNGDWICVRAYSEEAQASGLTGISFLPTNTLDESYHILLSSVRVVFTETSTASGEEDGFCGVTVTTDGEGPLFACLSNHVWQTVPRSVATPVLGEECELDFFLRKDDSSLSYFVRLPSGRFARLLTVALEGGTFPEIQKVDVVGTGDVTDLTGIPYSTDLIRITTEFDDDTLYPGTNFEQSVANGNIEFEKLWETDRTNGVLRVVIRDRNGLVIDERYFTFRGVDEKLRFEFLIKNLQPGESYTAEVVAGIPDVESDDASAEGFMARIVTNDTWATSNLWVRENARTFAGEESGTGIWMTNGVSAVVVDGCISINTSVADADIPAEFLATNALPKHTGFEYRMNLYFDKPSFDYPGYAGAFGATVLADATDDSTPLRFALLTNGVWMAVDSDIYEPKTGVEYELTLHVDLKECTAYYAVWTEGDRRAVTLVEFPLAEAFVGDRYKTQFYGVGRVRTHEGDGFDVRLVEIEPTYDETSLVPGTNFTETAVSGTLNIRQLWPTDRTSGSCTIVVLDAHGNRIKVETLTYDQLTNQSFNVFIDNLNPGEAYDVEIVSDVAGESVSSDAFVAVMARKYGAWISEDAETFDFRKLGTGDWVVSNESAHVEGEDIVIDADLDSSTLAFHPTNDTLAIRSSQIRELRFNLNFSCASWYETSSPPETPSNTLAAVAVYSYDADLSKDVPDTALAVLGSNQTWQVLGETRGKFSETNACEVTILCDLQNGFVRYTFASGSYTNRVYQFDLDPKGRCDFNIAFSGRGSLRTLDGDVWDTHLIRNSTNEFYDLESAIRATDNENDVLSPLWWARQYVTLPRGTFRVFDTNDWLTVVFPDWYYVVKTTDGKITVYRFNSSNNWIDYAEGGESNVVIDVERSLFFVKTPEGLSWIAALATNEWVSGRIELATNIDLTVHNWTPIAGFSGVFDGCGWRIDGLNNTNRWVGIPGGEYVFGPTNEWGRSTYGLFGTATNASLANVTFAGVAISNLADSVGALAGALAGNCTVSNVTVESGSILGVGGTVAGLAGYADFTDSLTFVNNTNAALVAADSDFFGEGRTAAGILCIAGPTDVSAPLGTVVVTNNVNTGVISNTLYDADLFGGNVAQILAGTTLGARFGDVHLTNNVAAGSVDVLHVNSEVFGWTPQYPAVNLASAFWGLDENETFLHALDANEPGAVAVDPVHRTARMLSDIFANGSTSHVGRVNDAMTALPSGATYVLPEGLNEWGSIRLDRDVTFDMNGKTVFMIYINNAFEISAGVNALVKDGTIVIGNESAAFDGETSGLTTENVRIEKMDDSDFYERTTFLIDGEFASLAELDVTALNGAGTVIELFDNTCISIDVDTGVLKLDGVTFMTLSEAYSFKTLKDDDGAVIGYRVILADTAANMPQLSVSVSATEVSVAVTNTRKGMTYQLQKKDSIVATSWTDVGEGVPVTVDNTPVELKDESPSADQGFYRVKATETE